MSYALIWTKLSVLPQPTLAKRPPPRKHNGRPPVGEGRRQVTLEKRSGRIVDPNRSLPIDQDRSGKHVVNASHFDLLLMVLHELGELPLTV